MDVRRGRMPHPRKGGLHALIFPRTVEATLGGAIFNRALPGAWNAQGKPSAVGRALRARRLRGCACRLHGSLGELALPCRNDAEWAGLWAGRRRARARGTKRRHDEPTKWGGGTGGATDSSSPTPGGRRVPPSSGRREEFAHGGSRGGWGGTTGAWGARGKRTSRRGAEKSACCNSLWRKELRIWRGVDGFSGVDGGGDFCRMGRKIPGSARFRRCGARRCRDEKGDRPLKSAKRCYRKYMEK